MITTVEKHQVDLTKVKPGDIFSEESHYIFVSKSGSRYNFRHLESDEEVQIGSSYVEKYFTVADQYDREVEVGKEDKFWTNKQIKDHYGVLRMNIPADAPREGDLRQAGIRTIWSNIHTSKVFTVCFTKQGSELSAKAYEAALQLQVTAAVKAIEDAARSKKGVERAAKEAIEYIQQNPIQLYIPGEERILRGYKIQFSSINGMYSVVDMDITEENNIRQVNVNTIKWLIYDKVKYVVK